MTFETTDALLAGATVPDFSAEPGSEFYAVGWRLVPEITADGPGSGVHGIRNGEVLCVIRWEQPAGIEEDGTFTASEAFSLVIQCRTAPDPEGRRP